MFRCFSSNQRSWRRTVQTLKVLEFRGSLAPAELARLGADKRGEIRMKRTYVTAIKTLIWSIFVPGTVTLLVPYFLLSSGFDSFRINLSSVRFFGLIPILVGAMIYIWCAWDFTIVGKGTPAPFDPPTELVVKGPYQYVRNPMYVFVALALTGEAILFETTILVLFAAVALTFFHLWVMLYEEPALKRRFGQSYKTYCDGVSRWLPSLHRRIETKTT